MSLVLLRNRRVQLTINDLAAGVYPGFCEDLQETASLAASFSIACCHPPAPPESAGTPT